MNSSFSEFEKKSDEITATGGHRILSPVDVNDVLYRLSHATTLRFEVPTKVSYRLSHATTNLLSLSLRILPVWTTD